jgi:hypothetical protein
MNGDGHIPRGLPGSLSAFFSLIPRRLPREDSLCRICVLSCMLCAFSRGQMALQWV